MYEKEKLDDHGLVRHGLVRGGVQLHGAGISESAEANVSGKGIALT